MGLRDSLSVPTLRRGERGIAAPRRRELDPANQRSRRRVCALRNGLAFGTCSTPTVFDRSAFDLAASDVFAVDLP
jgi:hypothetical protein